mgnify:CR=1 FL=1
MSYDLIINQDGAFISEPRKDKTLLREIKEWEAAMEEFIEYVMQKEKNEQQG